MARISSRVPAILVVDDDPIVSRLLPRFLRSVASGIPILVASGGVQALDVLAARPVRLVITDDRLPGMSGLELARAIRAGWPAIRIILLSGSITADLAEHAPARHYVDASVVKPFTRAQIAQVVQTVLA